MSFTFWSRVLWAPRAAFWDKFALRTRVFWVDFWCPRICASSSACKISLKNHSSDIFSHPNSPLFLHFSIKLVNFKLRISNFIFIRIVSYSILLKICFEKFEIYKLWQTWDWARLIFFSSSACSWKSRSIFCLSFRESSLNLFCDRFFSPSMIRKLQKLVKLADLKTRRFLLLGIGIPVSLFYLCWIFASSCFVDSSPSSLESSEYADRADFERFIFVTGAFSIRDNKQIGPWKL